MGYGIRKGVPGNLILNGFADTINWPAVKKLEAEVWENMCAIDCKIWGGLAAGGTKVDFTALNAGQLRATEAARKLTAG